MKVSRHRDGTYSLTDLSREDLSKLTFGATSAAAWYASPPPAARVTEDDKAWNASQFPLFDALYDALHIVSEARTAGSVTTGDRYEVLERRGLEPWSAA